MACRLTPLTPCCATHMVRGLCLRALPYAYLCTLPRTPPYTGCCSAPAKPGLRERRAAHNACCRLQRFSPPGLVLPAAAAGFGSCAPANAHNAWRFAWFAGFSCLLPATLLPGSAYCSFAFTLIALCRCLRFACCLLMRAALAFAWIAPDHPVLVNMPRHFLRVCRRLRLALLAVLRFSSTAVSRLPACNTSAVLLVRLCCTHRLDSCGCAGFLRFASARCTLCSAGHFKPDLWIYTLVCLHTPHCLRRRSFLLLLPRRSRDLPPAMPACRFRRRSHCWFVSGSAACSPSCSLGLVHSPIYTYKFVYIRIRAYCCFVLTLTCSFSACHCCSVYGYCHLLRSRWFEQQHYRRLPRRILIAD